MVIPLTCQDFNEKYSEYLEKGYNGLDLYEQEAIDYLDKEFQELIKIPGFKYHQIKSKFNLFCFYATGPTWQKRMDIERRLKEIILKRII